MTQHQLYLKKERQLKLLLFLVGLFLFFTALVKVNNLLISFVLAQVYYFLLTPWVDLLERKGVSRQIASIVPFFALSLILTVAGYWIFPILAEQAVKLQIDFPKYLDGTIALIDKIDLEITAALKDIYPIKLSEQIQPQIVELAETFLRDLPGRISRSLTVLVLAPFLAFFMILDGRAWFRKILTFVPNSIFELALNLNYQIGKQMGGFIRARLLESLIISLVIWVGLVFLNFPYALVLSLFAGLLNLVPYVGPLLAALPAVLISLINTGGTSELLGITMIYLVAQIIDTAIIVPVLVAKIVNLHPVTVVISIIVGSQVLGILGMIIAIPIASVLKVTLASLYEHVTDFRG